MSEQEIDLYYKTVLDLVSVAGKVSVAERERNLTFRSFIDPRCE